MLEQLRLVLVLCLKLWLVEWLWMKEWWALLVLCKQQGLLKEL